MKKGQRWALDATGDNTIGGKLSGAIASLIAQHTSRAKGGTAAVWRICRLNV